MNQKSRRTFLLQVAGMGSAMMATQALVNTANAATLPKLTEADAVAAALGYKLNTTKVDQKKFPKHAADQKCDGCTLYQGKPKEAGGACTLFAGKEVAANGWCSAWVKKA